jgi:type IV pilus assembly protein PilC
MEFHCRLGSPSGEIVEGVYIAEDEAKLRQQLEEKGLYVLSLQRKGTFGSLGLSLPQRRRVKAREFIVFNQELATLLKAGMPVVQSLDILRQRVENSVLKSVLDDVHDRVRSGAALSDAFEAHGDLFPGVYTASLLAGEKSGSLEEVLRRYVAYSRVIDTVRRKTLSALIYPAILLALSLIVVLIIVLRVVPEFGDFYEGLGAELPLSTRVIVATSEALRQNLLAIVILVVGGAALGWAWLRQSGSRAALDRVLLEIPGVGGIARRFATSQLARTLSTLLRGGIPLVTALDVAARSIGNRYFSQQLATVSREVREGQPLSTTLSRRGIFPPVAVKMVEVGESTGALQEMLTSVADFFDEEIETALLRFMTLVEPLLLVIMGIVIAGLLLALYMPLIQLGSIV